MTYDALHLRFELLGTLVDVAHPQRHNRAHWKRETEGDGMDGV